MNAYFTVPNREKIWTVLDQEIGDDTENARKSSIIVIALYRLKISGASFRAHFVARE